MYDVQDLQKKVAEQCKQTEPAVRALFTICEIDGKTVVSAEIPGVDISERPVFYKGVGRIKGSYVRVGESDEPMSEYEIYSYKAFGKRTRDDIRVAENAKFTMINGLFTETLPVTDSIADFCITPRSRDEIAAFVGKSKNYVMSQMVNPFVENGTLKLTLPDKPKSPHQKYVKA